jgi:hypothetical protein
VKKKLAKKNSKKKKRKIMRIYTLKKKNPSIFPDKTTRTVEKIHFVEVSQIFFF